MLNRLNKEKKLLAENNSKAEEDQINVSDKLDHLTKLKTKLENTLDELEGAYDKEKRNRAKIEKERRQVEGELKLAQQNVLELERSKKEFEAIITRKENEMNGLHSKLDDEQGLMGKSQKGIKELQGRVEEMEEELEAERQARAKAERQRSDLARELEELGQRLSEAGGATSAQIELNKKRESELTKLRKDLEECNIQQECTAASLKKRHQDAIAEMSEQIDQLSKIKNR